jgi:hypothetical protein
MVFPLTKSAFTSIETKSQSGSTRTSFPASSSARALFSLDAAIVERRDLRQIPMRHAQNVR